MKLYSIILCIILVMGCAKPPKPVTSKTPFIMPYQTITVR